MADKIDLSDKLKLAINGAYERGHPVVVAYVDEAGKPSLSVRGSAQVVGEREVGLWARKTDSGMAKAIETNPEVALIFFGNLPDGSKMLATMNGRARADRGRNAEVYDTMSETEQKYDPDGKGVAVFVEVDTVMGMNADGPFRQQS